MAADTNHHRSNNDSRESKEGHVRMGLVPSQDRAASRPLGEAREPPSALAIAMKACPGPRSGMDSGTGRRESKAQNVGLGLVLNRVNAAGLYQLMRDRSYNGRIIKQLFALSCAHPDDRTNPVLLSTSGRLGSPSEYEKCKTNAPTNRH